MVMVLIRRLNEAWAVLLRIAGLAVVSELVVALALNARPLLSRPLDLLLVCSELACGLAVVLFVRPQRPSVNLALFFLVYTWTLLRLALYVWAATWLV